MSNTKETLFSLEEIRAAAGALIAIPALEKAYDSAVIDRNAKLELLDADNENALLKAQFMAADNVAESMKAAYIAGVNLAESSAAKLANIPSALHKLIFGKGESGKIGAYAPLKKSDFGDNGDVFKRYTKAYLDAAQKLEAKSISKGGELSSADFEDVARIVNTSAECICYYAGIPAIHFGAKHIRAFWSTSASVMKAGGGYEVIRRRESALKAFVEKDMHNAVCGLPRMESIKGNAKTAEAYAKACEKEAETKAKAEAEKLRVKAKAELEEKVRMKAEQEAYKERYGGLEAPAAPAAPAPAAPVETAPVEAAPVETPAAPEEKKDGKKDGITRTKKTDAKTEEVTSSEAK